MLKVENAKLPFTCFKKKDLALVFKIPVSLFHCPSFFPTLIHPSVRDKVLVVWRFARWEDRRPW